MSDTLIKAPLQLSGVLDQYDSFDVTPIIGREFPTANLKEWLQAANSDAILRDLATTVSQRGVVFFRKQDDIDDDLQKELAQRLGELSGKPKTSGLHIHPILNSSREMGGDDERISILSREMERTQWNEMIEPGKRQSAIIEWHNDITFEVCPSDYAVLRLTELPKCGGDTLWASGYELYDRISKPYQKFLQSLTATCAQPGHAALAKRQNFELYAGPRGSPENVGTDLQFVHPVVRTNPVTGWNSVFAVGAHVQCINDVTEMESHALLLWFLRLIVENHDLQVRHRWINENDMAIWDNRCVYHAPTPDLRNSDPRTGHRAVSIGERPYLDPNSTGRREALSRIIPKKEGDDC
ncbi:hypothetical protein Egran_04863 [Elaphomyces granulatus]|uniref:TauD/TfdA-like domain-containing protein n=1 Tax=Elaphomyces granulatus TaxID=519963 RepID=A0A232LTB6_9EURO|nr:hypothetical protein Egran_04863 [Elaphomyces granulatus]